MDIKELKAKAYDIQIQREYLTEQLRQLQGQIVDYYKAENSKKDVVSKKTK
jgi:hypothetical protein